MFVLFAKVISISNRRADDGRQPSIHIFRSRSECYYSRGAHENMPYLELSVSIIRADSASAYLNAVCGNTSVCG